MRWYSPVGATYVPTSSWSSASVRVFITMSRWLGIQTRMKPMQITYGTILRVEAEQFKSGEVPCRQIAVTMACFQKKIFRNRKCKRTPLFWPATGELAWWPACFCHLKLGTSRYLIICKFHAAKVVTLILADNEWTVVHPLQFAVSTSTPIPVRKVDVVWLPWIMHGGQRERATSESPSIASA